MIATIIDLARREVRVCKS